MIGLSRIAATFALAAGAVLIPVAARAEFALEEPWSWAEQEGEIGNPQLSAPCGQADPGIEAIPTGASMTRAPGDQVPVTINETVAHPGHYRVVLSTTGPSGLPDDPLVTPDATPCGSTEIHDPPVFPVLADGMLVHTDAFSEPQTFMVTLPDDVSCGNCTMQVVEFMSAHDPNVPGGCFFHHCANMVIYPRDAGGGSTVGSRAPDALGCAFQSCAVGGEDPSLAGVVASLALLARRRRRPRGIFTASNRPTIRRPCGRER